MRMRSRLLALCLLMAAPALAASPFGGGKGTDILHLTLRTALTAPGGPGPEGELSLKLRQQGHADVQKLTLEARGLVGGDTYHLAIQLRGGSGATEVPAFAFQADPDGTASLKLMHLGQVNKPGKTFPDGLDPLSDVATFEIHDVNHNPVLTADVAHPDFLQYLVKRRLDTTSDAEGSLLLKQYASKESFRLRAANLGMTAPYTLTINCPDVNAIDCGYKADFTSDEKGRLDIKSLPGTPPHPFEMTQVQLIDGSGIVLRTDLP